MQTTVSIPGIHCASCAAVIKDVSADFPQITRADVDIETKKVILEHSDDFDFQRWKTEIESLSDKYKVHVVS